jgi:Mor family transcriptional regulator
MAGLPKSDERDWITVASFKKVIRFCIFKRMKSMGRGRKPAKELSYRDKKIVERYNSTFDTMPRLAKKYGITKQRIHEILIRAKRLGYVIKRQKLLARYHDVHQCEVCNKILQIAEKDDLITRKQLPQMLRIEDGVCHWHLNQLKGSGFVSKKFASMRSEKLAKALQYYKDHSLSTNAVGKKFGYKNFYSILSYQKKKGLNVERMLSSPIVPNLKQEEQIAIFPSMSQTEF